MSRPAVVPSLDWYKARAVKLVGNVQALARRTVEEGWEAGRALADVKTASPHGTYRKWLASVGIKRETDRTLRKLYAMYPQKTEVRSFASVTQALGTGKHSRWDATGRLARPGNATHDNDDEWYTPREVVEAARRALGGIDLDPASCDVAQETVRAARYFTKADDGLSRPWEGRVFLNPPFSVKAGKAEFVAKLVEHYVAGDVEAAVLVTSVDFGGAWAAPLREHVAATCSGTGRTKFHHPEKSNDPALPSAFHYFGPDLMRFAEAFAGLGQVAVAHTDTRAGIMPTSVAHDLLRIDHEIERLRLAAEVKDLVGPYLREEELGPFLRTAVGPSALPRDD